MAERVVRTKRLTPEEKLRIVAEAWADERSMLRPIPEWILSSVTGEGRAGVVPVLPQSPPVADHHLIALEQPRPDEGAD